MERKIGRPRVYSGERKGVIIYFGTELLKKIDETAKKNKLSRIEYINFLVVQGDDERVRMLGNMYSGIKEQLFLMAEEKETDDKKYYDCMKKLSSIIGNSIMADVYEPLLPDDRCRKIFDTFKPIILELKLKNPDFPTKEQLDYWVEKIYSEVQDITLDDGMRIRKPNVIKDLIKKMINDNSKQTIFGEINVR